MTDTTTTDHADLIARAKAAKASLAARPDSTAKRMFEYLEAAKKLDPAVIIERDRRIRAILDGAEDVKVVAAKKARKTRAAPFTQAQVRRAVKAAESAGLQVKRVTVSREGSIAVESGGNDVSPIDSRETALAASWDDI